MKATRSGGVEMLWWMCMIWHGCMHMLLGGVKRVHDVSEMDLQREQAAGAGNR